jgi:predicted ArsR family transcriptional regulator
MSVRRVREKQENKDEQKKEVSTRVITVEDDEMGNVIGSVSSDTALDILDSVHESPKVSTELAEELGVTTQNVRYHLDNLEEAGLVEVEDVRYSEKGRVMSVYRPAESPLMIVFGKESDEVLQK